MKSLLETLAQIIVMPTLRLFELLDIVGTPLWQLLSSQPFKESLAIGFFMVFPMVPLLAIPGGFEGAFSSLVFTLAITLGYKICWSHELPLPDLPSWSVYLITCLTVSGLIALNP